LASSVSIAQPNCFRAAIINLVSSLCNVLCNSAEPLRAASTSARLVMLFDPGTETGVFGGFASGVISILSGYASGIRPPHQEESLWRGGGAGFAAVFGGQDLADDRLGPESAADVDQRAGDRPHHVVEEAVRFDIDPNVVADAVHGQMRDRADAGQTVGP